MKIDLISQLKKWEMFFQEYKSGDENKLYDGKSLIYYSLANNNLESRYTISKFLLDKEVDVITLAKYNESVLHMLLGHDDHNLNETVNLCKNFIDLGVDINVLDYKKVLALQFINNMTYTYTELKPLYDIWFSQPYVDVTTKNFRGYSPMDLIIKSGDKPELLERMEKWI